MMEEVEDESNTTIKTCVISNLHESMNDWVILCRVNYINKVECSNGLFANNFMIEDEEGDEIKCCYFENPLDEEKKKL